MAVKLAYVRSAISQRQLRFLFIVGNTAGKQEVAAGAD